MCSGFQRGELSDLQRKYPEDLWKEDLAIFIEELDVSFVSIVRSFPLTLDLQNMMKSVPCTFTTH